MIYSGVDLIRKADQTQARAEKFAGPQGVVKSDPPRGDQQKPDQQGTLLRFARFINNERRKKPVSKPGKHPYTVAFAQLRHKEDSGLLLDIYA